MIHRAVRVDVRPRGSLNARAESQQEGDRGSALAGAATELRRLIERAAAGHPATCILLSGGLDTFVVRTLKTFDPMEIRNSIVVARGLREAARLGYATVMTGDAADELFGGYSFMWSKPEGEFERFSEHLASVMRFSSVPLGAALGIDVKTPYLDPAVVAFALRLSKAQKVGVRAGVTYGKFLLRLAFPEVEACWRRKDPIEVGAGTAVLPDYFRARIPSREFDAERERIGMTERVEIRDPEHLAYYRVFRQAFGDSPPLRRFASDPRSKCGFELPRRDSDGSRPRLKVPNGGPSPTRVQLGRNSGVRGWPSS